MSFVATKGKYHVALDGVGLILQGAPDRLGFTQTQAPIYGQRFASGDRDYNDLSQWWYFVQTDWSGGFKDSQSWADDAKYYHSTNIDTWSEVGAMKLTRKQFTEASFAEEIICGAIASVAGSTHQYIGTNDTVDSRPRVYRASLGQGNSFTDISTTTIDTSQNLVSQISATSGILWVSTVGNGATDVVLTYNGTTWTDQTASIDGADGGLPFQSQASRSHCEHQGRKYIFVENFSNNYYGLVSTAVANPTAASDYDIEFTKLNEGGQVLSCIAQNGVIYFLVYKTAFNFYAFDIASSTLTHLRTFAGSTAMNWGVGDKLLVDLNGDIIITIPQNEIWKLSNGSLTRLMSVDEFKRTFSTATTIRPYLDWGAILYDNKVWWGNLMYDGTNFHNTWRETGDSTSNVVRVLYADLASNIFQLSQASNTQLYSMAMLTGLFKGADNNNYLVFNNFDNVAGVDKLAYSMTILFKPLASGQSIEVEYLLGEMTTSPSWTALGTASATVDGTTVRDKTFFFGNAIIFKKIWFRVKLEGGGGDTPALTDVVMEYLPVPSFKKLWKMRINCGDEVKMLDGRNIPLTGRELRSRLENAWWTKSLLDFQDFDYATTTVADNPLSSSATTVTVAANGTLDFPEQGRIRIEDEDILYTGKTPTTFTGCIRGARGTRAVSHVQNTVVNNGYKVILTDLEAQVPVMLEDKNLEYVLTVSVREA